MGILIPHLVVIFPLVRIQLEGGSAVSLAPRKPSTAGVKSHSDSVRIAHEVIGPPLVLTENISVWADTLIRLDTIYFEQVGLQEMQNLLKLQLDQLVFGLLQQGEREAKNCLDPLCENNVEHSVDQRQGKAAVSGVQNASCQRTGMRTAS